MQNKNQIVIKTFLITLLFTGIGTVIIVGGYMIGDYYKNKIENIPVEEEIVITTDKMEYEQGEEVKITIRNNSNNSIWHLGNISPHSCKNAFDIGIKEENYEEFYSLSGAYCIGGPRELKSHSVMMDQLNPKEGLALLVANEHIQFPATYKLKFRYGYEKDRSSQAWIYSNEFTIKEKAVIDTSNWQTYRNEEFNFEMKHPEYYFENRYDLENMTDLDYKRIHFFRDMNNSELDDFKEHYITSFYEEGTHSGTIDIKSYNENELKAWYAIDSFNNLKFKEYSNFKVYILEIREVGFYYIIPHNNIDNSYFVFSIPAFLQNDFENNWLSTFKFTNQNTSISDIIKGNKKIEHLKDFEFQNLPNYVFQEQKGATYKLENYIFQFIKQPNLNTPLSIPSSDIKYKGALYSRDNGSSWNDFFVIDNPKDYKGNEVKYNPVGMFVKDNKLYLDISDDRGAGSGEGNLLRYSTEDGKIWIRDSCLYLMPELYFNGSDGIKPFAITGNSDCIYSPVSLCTDKSFGTAIGSDVYPIDLKYKNLHFLGQLFTAADCGPERLSQIWGVDGENYTLGPRIVLKDNPSQELINIFKSIGFNCCDKIFDNKCKQWSHDNYSIKISELLKLEPYHKSFDRDDCINCG